MTPLFATTVDAVGPEAAELMDAGVLILFASGAPPELAEISVTHDVLTAGTDAPLAGDVLRIDADHVRITAIGDTAWRKTCDLGHVVLSFNGASIAERPGEICCETLPPGRLRTLIQPGTMIEIARDARSEPACAG